MLVHRTKQIKKVFWEFDSIIMQNMIHNLLLFCAPTWPPYHVIDNHRYGHVGFPEFFRVVSYISVKNQSFQSYTITKHGNTKTNQVRGRKIEEWNSTS